MEKLLKRKRDQEITIGEAQRVVKKLKDDLAAIEHDIIVREQQDKLDAFLETNSPALLVIPEGREYYATAKSQSPPTRIVLRGWRADGSDKYFEGDSYETQIRKHFSEPIYAPFNLNLAGKKQVSYDYHKRECNGERLTVTATRISK